MARGVNGRLMACVAVLGSLCACGAIEQVTQGASTARLSAVAALDGWVDNLGIAVAAGGTPGTGDADVFLNGYSRRQFFTFDLSDLPAGARIESATLDLYQSRVTGDPYTKLGNVVVDHVSYGSSLDKSDYSEGTLQSAIATLSTNANVESKRVDVTVALERDRSAGRTLTQFRIRFSVRDSNSDRATDQVFFSDAELSNPGQPPTLTVSYRN